MRSNCGWSMPNRRWMLARMLEVLGEGCVVVAAALATPVPAPRATIARAEAAAKRRIIIDVSLLCPACVVTSGRARVSESDYCNDTVYHCSRG